MTATAMLSIPKSATEIDNAWLEQVLRKKYGDGYRLTSSQCTSMANLAALCSEMYPVTCRGQVGSGEITDHLVAKLLPLDPNGRKVVINQKMARCETFVYSELLPALIQFEKGYGLSNIKTMTVPFLHAARNAEGEEYVIVMENVQQFGFWTPRPVSLPLETLPVAVKKLAQLAATSNAYLRKHNLRDLPIVSTHLPEDHLAKTFIKMALEKMTPTLQERGHDALLRKLQKMSENCTEIISQGLQPRHPNLRVISHGDFRDGNFLIKQNDDLSWDLKVVDWQVCMISHPTTDLIYLSMFSLSREVMKQMETNILETYFSEFQRCLQALDVSCPLTFQELQEDFTRAKYLGMMWSMASIWFFHNFSNWAERCVDIALEVDQLGLMDHL